MNLQLANGLLQGFFGLGFGGVSGRNPIGIMVGNGIEGGAPGPEGFGLVVLERQHAVSIDITDMDIEYEGERGRKRTILYPRRKRRWST